MMRKDQKMSQLRKYLLVLAAAGAAVGFAEKTGVISMFSFTGNESSVPFPVSAPLTTQWSNDHPGDGTAFTISGAPLV